VSTGSAPDAACPSDELAPGFALRLHPAKRVDRANRTAASLTAQITQSGSVLTFVVGPIGGRYEGTIKDAQIDGAWTQGPQSFPLTLKRQPR